MRGLDLLATDTVSQEHREEAERLNQLGDDSLEEGFFRLAELRFLEAFEMDRSNPVYELNLGRAILSNPKRAPAVRVRMARVHLELAAKRMPENALALYYLGLCQTRGDDPLNARRNLDEAIRLKDGRFPEATRLLGELGGSTAKNKRPATTQKRGLFGWLRTNT
ncbi:MAG: tetratricopeptide (TPR) repeat protein [Myxococcota bacterium]|jgi:tetratricopeptide (TPR) repeat protein